MSMDSLLKPKPLSALVVVEGEKSEIEFFELFGNRMGLNLKLHAVRCNVYTLFRWMTDDCAVADLTCNDLVLDVPRLIAQHEENEQERALLQQHYDALYLVYDCDLQDSRVSDKDNPPPIESRARANFVELDQMVKLLDDEYSVTVGKLYLNYPMFEACLDADSFSDPAFQSREASLDELLNDGYKHRVKGRLLHNAWLTRTDWKREDFFDLIRMNVCKAAHLLKVNDVEEYTDDMEHFLSQKAILKRQRENVQRTRMLTVLNTSVFMPIEQFGAKYPSFYAQVMRCRDYPTICFADDGKDIQMHSDFMTFLYRARPTNNLLLNELKGLIRVFPHVDVIVFTDDFCCSMPDYRNLLKEYNMSDDKAKNAALLRLRGNPNVNYCCRVSLTNGEKLTIEEIAERIKRSIIFVREQSKSCLVR